MEYGTITYKGKVITYTSDAVMENSADDYNGDRNRPPVRTYVSTGEDEDGNEYIIKWLTRDDFWHMIDADGVCIDDCSDEEKDELSWSWQCEDDESNACDWDEPSSIKAV